KKDAKQKDEALPAKDEPKDDKDEKKEPRKTERGFLQRATADGEHKYWIHVPRKYDDNVAHGILVWLHPPERNKEGDIKEFVEAWEDICEENNLIIVAPKSETADGWIASEGELVVGAVREV